MYLGRTPHPVIGIIRTILFVPLLFLLCHYYRWGPPNIQQHFGRKGRGPKWPQAPETVNVLGL